MSGNMALLGSSGDTTSFSYDGVVIRFRTSHHLIRYTDILEWDRGYIVVKARYDNYPDELEEYIDLIPILQKLYIVTDNVKNIERNSKTL